MSYNTIPATTKRTSGFDFHAPNAFYRFPVVAIHVFLSIIYLYDTYFNVKELNCICITAN